MHEDNQWELIIPASLSVVYKKYDRVIKHHARPHKPTPPQPTRVSCQFKKVAHLNHNTLRKVLLKNGRVPPQKGCLLSCPQFHGSRVSLFIVSRLYLLVVVSDRSAGLVHVGVAAVCLFSFFLYYGYRSLDYPLHDV